MAIEKILIVDDSATDLVNLSDAIADTGCEIISASSGAEAIEKAKSEMPDLIFMDIVMHEMNGYEACRAIKETPETANIPIVFVSSKNHKADELWAKRQGGEALVGKPYTNDQIVEQIKRLS